jgi:hypothetical protein
MLLRTIGGGDDDQIDRSDGGASERGSAIHDIRSGRLPDGQVVLQSDAEDL